MSAFVWASDGGDAGCCAVLGDAEAYIALRVSKHEKTLALKLDPIEARRLGKALLEDAAELDRLPPGIRSGEG